MPRKNSLATTMLKAVSIGALLCTTSAMAAIPQPGDPQGTEFPVNTVTAHAQTAPAVAADAAGDHVVVWTSDLEDGDGLGVFAQLYHADGTAAGGEIPVNTTTTAGDQASPKVAMDASGDFVVVWTSADADGLGIFARRFKADGTPAGGEFPVNVSTTGDQSKPSVAMNAAGRFAVVWNGPAVDGLGDVYQAPYARIYDDTGTPVIGEMLVNLANGGDQSMPSVAMDAAGDFAVAYVTLDNGDGVTEDLGIEVKVFNPTGTALIFNSHGLDVISANDTTAGDQTRPSVAMDAAGLVVVAWQGPDSDGLGVYADRFSIFPDDGDSTSTTGEQLVNTTTAGDQSMPSVASDAAGDFVVTWISSDVSSTGISARIYTPVLFSTVAFTPIGGEIAVNTTTAGDQSASAVALDAAGDMLAVWQGPDADLDGIFGQRFARQGSLDLSAGLVVAPAGTVRPGSSVSLTASVTNHAGVSTLTGISTIDDALTTATGVEADITVPVDATGVSGSGSGWNCDALSGNMLPCHYTPGLTAGAVTPALTVTLDLSSVALGVQSFSNDVSGAQPDASIANNSSADGVTADGPVADDGVLTVNKNSSNNAGTLVATTDADGDALSFVKLTDPAHGTVTVNANGSFSYTPNAGFFGLDSFTFRVFAGPVLESNIATVSITVVDNPPVANDGVLTVNKNSRSNVGTLVATDPDGDTLSFFKLTDPAHGTVTVNSNGSFSYTPNAGFSGPDSFTFRVFGGIVMESNIATVSITVVDHPPVASDGVLTVNENSSNNAGTLAATDADGDAVSFFKLTDPAHGTVTVNANGSFSYTPAAGYAGPDSFTFRAIVGIATLSNIATVSITVTHVDHPPVASDGVLTVNENSSNNAGTLAATDADGDTLSFIKLTDPAHGTVTVNSNGSFSYTPAAGFSGPDSFTFRAFGGPVVESNIATVSITVTHVDSAPVAVPGVLKVKEGSSKDAGTLVASDADTGDTLTFSKVAAPAHGKVTVDADGSYSYTPTAGFSGSDSFTFKANDGSMDSNVAKVSITVTHVNQAPVAAAGTLAVDRNSPKTGTVTASDADGDARTYKVVQVPGNGIVTLQSNGSFSYKPKLNFSGADSFTFKANDGTVDSNVATVSITVTEHAPVGAALTFSMTRNTAHTGTLKVTDTDSGDTHTFSKSTSPKHGTVVIAPNTGGFTYTPAKNFAGNDSFVFKVSDGAQSDTATVTITVK